MVTYENPIRLVRELKGAPLSILFALALVQQRVTQEWLERSTGYTDKPISQALEYMKEIGLVDRSSAGWQLTKEGRQLPLPLQFEGVDGDQVVEEMPAETENASDLSILPKDVSRNISDSSLIIITTDSESESNNNSNNINRAKKRKSRKNSDSGGVKRRAVDKSVDNSCLQALAEAGILEPKRSRLARLEHVDAGYVRLWEQQLKNEKGSGYKPGLLIYVIESGAQRPRVNSRGHLEGCGCETCQQNKYQDGIPDYDNQDYDSQERFRGNGE